MNFNRYLKVQRLSLSRSLHGCITSSLALLDRFFSFFVFGSAKFRRPKYKKEKKWSSSASRLRLSHGVGLVAANTALFATPPHPSRCILRTVLAAVL